MLFTVFSFLSNWIMPFVFLLFVLMIFYLIFTRPKPGHGRDKWWAKN